MLNIAIVGVGGQGVVLAAKILAQAAQNKGWNVRTAETIGMAQRGGSVVSHVRIGNNGEEVWSPLPATGTVDAILAMEPGEAARNISLLKEGGIIVTAKSAIVPGGMGVEATSYNARAIISSVKELKIDVVELDDEALNLGKSLNVAILARAMRALDCGITVDDVKDGLRACVKPEFVDMNLSAIEKVERL